MTGMRNMLLAGVVALAGCGVGSVNPTIGEVDAEYKQDLLGSWQSSEGGESAVISADNANGYIVVYNEDGGKAGRFIARGGTIGGRRVLDVQPDASASSANESYRALILPLHTVLFIDSLGATVSFRTLEPDSVAAVLRREPSIVQHIVVDDAYVLTAPTPEVQKFIADVSARRGFLQEATIWTRKPATNAP